MKTVTFTRSSSCTSNNNRGDWSTGCQQSTQADIGRHTAIIARAIRLVLDKVLQIQILQIQIPIHNNLSTPQWPQ